MTNLSTETISINLTYLSTLDTDCQHLLFSLMAKCNNYEPYYTIEPDSSILMFAAFYKEDMIGFLSLLINEENSTAEATALISPAFQHKGIFTALLNAAKTYVSEHKNLADYTIIGSIPQNLVDTHFPYASTENVLFTEYMLKLTPEAYAACSFSASQSATATLPVSLDLSCAEFCFSENGLEYLMYADEDAQEPCGVLSISEEATFSNVYGVWVDEALRGKGVGTMLMQAFLEDYFSGAHSSYGHGVDTHDSCGHHADAHGSCEPRPAVSKPLVLNVRSTNTAACRLYKKCGFTEVSHISYYYIV